MLISRMIQHKFWLWLQWTVLSAAGWLLGLIATLLIHFSIIRLLKHLIALSESPTFMTALNEVMTSNIDDGIPGDFIGVQPAFVFGTLFGVLYGTTFGAVGGLTQTLILNRYISNARWWVLASALAWACIWGAIWGSAWAWGWTGTIVAIETGYGLLGATWVGLLEWLVLRKQISRSYGWIFATVMSWVISRLIVLELWNRLFTFPLSWLWILVGLGNGIVTGCMLMYMLPRLKHQASSN